MVDEAELFFSQTPTYWENPEIERIPTMPLSDEIRLEIQQLSSGIETQHIFFQMQLLTIIEAISTQIALSDIANLTLSFDTNNLTLINQIPQHHGFDLSDDEGSITTVQSV
ncbi:UNKNOWN [Stylonychia lemnae]|uniref:Uncharacterized protein n=1 Tax=Stylonychia lemnae TaxID=5949 RepID=A0A078ALV8_STYLE|nr:UNKNOWN [Stylonychia lemnae]|eukprot:CDW82372.1 UNKNOWN [Stylonychia lemnae]